MDRTRPGTTRGLGSTLSVGVEDDVLCRVREGRTDGGRGQIVKREREGKREPGEGVMEGMYVS